MKNNICEGCLIDTYENIYIVCKDNDCYRLLNVSSGFLLEDKFLKIEDIKLGDTVEVVQNDDWSIYTGDIFDLL